MKKLLFVFFLFTGCVVNAQNEPLIKPGRVIFYNTENFFDTIDEPLTDDKEFLPQSRNQWNTEKYQTKLQHIAKVLGAMLDTIQPIIIGLCEIENRHVLEDLIAQPALKKYDFGIVHHDSPDERGIDVAFLYNQEMIEFVFDSYLRIEYPFDPTDRTRDIIYFEGQMTEKFPIYFFVNHWTSRTGKKELSEEKRMFIAKTLEAKIHDIYKGNPDARIVIMGDLNDNPSDRSVQYLCSPTYQNPGLQKLVNLMEPLEEKQQYTLKYNAEKDVFDQFIVSKNLLINAKNFPYYIRKASAYIYRPGWILYDHYKYGIVPNRTFYKGLYTGGYSDHLPVYLDIAFH